MSLRFGFNEKKAIEALTYLASHWPGVSPFFAAKVLFFAEKWHLNRYARPIVADTFIAMPWGPVPSTIYDFIKGNLEFAGDPESFLHAVKVRQHRGGRELRAKREPNVQFLSASDRECLDEAITFCRARGVGALSELTHQERAWREAPNNGAMDYEAFIDEGPNREALLEQAREFAAYGVL
jgi:uncharacterized phage-associated protein